MPFGSKKGHWLAASALLLAASAGAADPNPFERCTSIQDREQRWRCYDEHAPQAASREGGESGENETCGASYTALSRLWNTRPTCESDLYRLLPYKQNYIIARYSNSPNNQPVSANFGRAPDQDLDHTELKFQFSLKVKVAEQLANTVDLWFGYSQQSNWQAFNAPNSRPFRESDYEPELIAGFPLHSEGTILGLTPRLINLGLVHQSNGQSDPLSRSWNRVYLQFGLDRDLETERDHFALLLRSWYRFEEGSSDNNPDIEHYLGYGDLLVFWKRGDNNVSALLRNNLQTQGNRGSLRLDWSVPITRLPHFENASTLTLNQHDLRFYVQIFTGYGETLIDYNRYQTTIGVGIMLTDWM